LVVELRTVRRDGSSAESVLTSIEDDNHRVLSRLPSRRQQLSIWTSPLDPCAILKTMVSQQKPAPSARGQFNPKKLTGDKARQIRIRHAAGESVESLAAEYGLSTQGITDVLRYLTWAFAGPEPPGRNS
jgi:hypothetical protein